MKKEKILEKVWKPTKTAPLTKKRWEHTPQTTNTPIFALCAIKINLEKTEKVWKPPKTTPSTKKRWEHTPKQQIRQYLCL